MAFNLGQTSSGFVTIAAVTGKWDRAASEMKIHYGRNKKTLNIYGMKTIVSWEESLKNIKVSNYL
jgi:hypothetical protein